MGDTISVQVKENRNKLKSFSLEILKKCQDKGFSIKEVMALPRYLEDEINANMSKHKRQVAFAIHEDELIE